MTFYGCSLPWSHSLAPCRQQCRGVEWGGGDRDSACVGEGPLQNCSKCLSKDKPVLFINWFSGL